MTSRLSSRPEPSEEEGACAEEPEGSAALCSINELYQRTLRRKNQEIAKLRAKIKELEDAAQALQSSGSPRSSSPSSRKPSGDGLGPACLSCGCTCGGSPLRRSAQHLSVPNIVLPPAPARPPTPKPGTEPDATDG
eukprot:RCo041663